MASSLPSDIQTWEVKEPYLKLHCKLGEGPYYERATNTLRFVDIIQKRLHTISLEQGKAPEDSLVTQQLDTPISVTADIAGVDPRDKILIGAKYGMAVLDRKAAHDQKDAYEYVAKFHKMKDNLRLRGNDGAVDPHGRFWLGTMTDFELGPFQSEGMRSFYFIFILLQCFLRGVRSFFGVLKKGGRRGVEMSCRGVTNELTELYSSPLTLAEERKKPTSNNWHRHPLFSI